MRRLFTYFLLGLLSLSFLGNLQLLLHTDLVVLDLPLLIVLHLAMSSDLTLVQPTSSMHANVDRQDFGSAVVACLLGYATDVVGGGVRGFHAFVLVVVFIAARRAARSVYLSRPSSTILVAGLTSFGTSLLCILVRLVISIPPSWRTFAAAVAQAIFFAALALPLLRMFRALDSRFARRSLDRGAR